MYSRIFLNDRNVWRIAKANRAAVLIDAGAFFGTLRRAFLQAQRTIFIVGWDIDSRTKLVGESGAADDGYSPILAELLSELVNTRPDLRVYILLWDFSIVYTPERELFPRLSLQWQTPPRVTLCMDGAVPFGSSQHQKLFIIDDTLAFSGGLDLTQRRWDTSDHSPTNPDRVDTDNRPYPPFHDVQMMVDGDAAHALAQLARRRWCKAQGTEPPIEPFGDPWPSDIVPHFNNVEVAIARTQPPFDDQEEVKEVEALFLASISQATRSIYIENQFMSSIPIAEQLARQLQQSPGMEILAISPRNYPSPLVGATLGEERKRFHKILMDAGGDRVRLLYPSVTKGKATADTMVHSKVMIIDDRFIRVGSANLNNRSMAVDTECDLAIEANTAEQRSAIDHIRNMLLADHCGTSVDVIRRTIADCGNSLIAAVDRISTGSHRLLPIDSTAPCQTSNVLKDLVDPKEPIVGSSMVRWIASYRPVAAISFLTLTLLVLTAAWYLTPISQYVSGEQARNVLLSAAASNWAPLWVLAIYVIGGAVAFPVLVLIVATAATFGPWYGFFYALMGALTSALVMYFVGRLLGQPALQLITGSRWERLLQEVSRAGVLAVASIRLVPVAPFTLVNLIAGACGIALVDYLAGTVIGMLPGLIAISLLGHQITALITNLSLTNFVLFLLLVAAWGAVAWATQTLANRWRGRTP